MNPWGDPEQQALVDAVRACTICGNGRICRAHCEELDRLFPDRCTEPDCSACSAIKVVDVPKTG